MKTPVFFGIHARPTRKMNLCLAALPFVIFLSAYLVFSHVRLAKDSKDKVMPSIARMIAAVDRVALSPHPRTGKIMIVQDTLASLERIGFGLGAAAVCGLLVGLNAGLFPGMRICTIPFVTFMMIIPPIALLPILLIAFQGGELAKPALIFLGTVFVIIRDTCTTVERIPREQITKSLTLGASQLQIVYEVVLPQIMPRFLMSVCLALGPAWIFLISSESLGASAGLGHQIFLQSRFFNMDAVIPYVLWITFLGFLADTMLRRFVSWKYAWYQVRS